MQKSTVSNHFIHNLLDELGFVELFMYAKASSYDYARRSALPQPLTRSSNLLRQSLKAAPVSQTKNFGRCLRNAPLKTRKIHS